MQRGQVLEEDLALGSLGGLAVDLVDLDQGEIAFAILRGADLAVDGVAGMQVEAADLRGRDVDVVRAGEVRGVGGAEEPESVREHFQRAVAEDRLPLFRAVLEHREDQVLLAQPVCPLDFVGDGHVDELGDVQGFQFR